MKTTDLRKGMEVELRNGKFGEVRGDLFNQVFIVVGGIGFLSIGSYSVDDMKNIHDSQFDIMKVMSKDRNGRVVWTREEKKEKFSLRMTTQQEKQQSYFQMNQIVKLKKKGYPLNPFGGLTYEEHINRRETLIKYRNGELVEIIDIYKGTDGAYYYKITDGLKKLNTVVHEDDIVKRGTTAEQRAKWFVENRIGVNIKQSIEKSYIKVIFKNETEKQLLKMFENNEPDYLVHYEHGENIAWITKRKYSIRELVSWNLLTYNVNKFLLEFYK